MKIMNPLRSRVAVAVLAFAIPLCWATAARAQAPAAEALFDQGKKALAAGDLDTACTRFRASDQLDPAAGTRANLGECEDRRGKVASAWEAFRGVLEKLPAGDPRLPVVQRRLKTLEARLPHLTMTLAPGAPKETTVREGEITLGTAATFGVPLPIDPGVHHLVVVATGHAPKSIDITLVEGKTETMAVEPGPAEAPAPPAVPSPLPPPPSSDSPGPWIVGGVGLAALIVGGVTGGIVLGKKSAADAGCNDFSRTCTPDGKAAADAGRALGPVSTVGLVLGAAGVAAGALWLGVRHSGRSTARMGVAPVAGGAAWRVEGSW